MTNFENVEFCSWVLSTVREHAEHFVASVVTESLCILVLQNGQIWQCVTWTVTTLPVIFFPYCCAVGGAVFSMSSIWMIVEYFVVLKYLLSLNVRTVTSLIAYVLFSTSVKLFSHRTSLILAVWSAIIASTLCSVLPLTLRVDCCPTENS